MELPLFPLHTVLCPGIALPLHIFEPRYRLMVARCLDEARPFGVVWIREGREVGTGDLAVAAVGTQAEVREVERHADGQYDLLVVGTRRFRIAGVDTDREPYLVARVEPVDEVLGDDGRAARLARIATRRFVRYVTQVGELSESEVDDADALRPTRRSWAGLKRPDAQG
jgi:Lon protease-like protein